ncbi:putative basic amino acid antiporter YfcC [bacterium]|nr:putative basic amino acid antiporter YfcC [bacterium]
MHIERVKIPGAFPLIFIIMTITAMLTWVIPGGRYERTVNQDGREIVVDDTFQLVDRDPQGVFALLQAPIKGIVQTARIIAFILLIGGVFGIIDKTKVITASILRAAHRLEERAYLVVPAGMLLFSVFGAVFGMSEEVIPFVLIFIPLALSLGYDSIVGISIPFLGAGLGFAGAMLNPFTIGIAQGIAELPIFSGIGYRCAVWGVVTGAGILMVMRYAAGIKKAPEKSPVYEQDTQRRERLREEEAEQVQFGTGHRLIIGVFFLTIAMTIIGVMRYHWYIDEIAALFLGMGLVSGCIARLSLDEIAGSFIAGARDLVGAALIVGFARGILVIASDGMIIDTVMHALSATISRLHPVFGAQVMFIIQSVLNFFIPSGSGKAALTMPIMTPLADLTGITRQTAVLAYQLGDGLTNMIVPTSGVTMGVLGMAKIEWSVWAKWLYPLVLVLTLIGLVLMVPPVLFRYGPF